MAILRTLQRSEHETAQISSTHPVTMHVLLTCTFDDSGRAAGHYNLLDSSGFGQLRYPEVCPGFEAMEPVTGGFFDRILVGS